MGSTIDPRLLLLVIPGLEGTCHGRQTSDPGMDDQTCNRWIVRSAVSPPGRVAALPGGFPVRVSCQPPPEGLRPRSLTLVRPRTSGRAGDGIRTRDVQLGKLAFYH